VTLPPQSPYKETLSLRRFAIPTFSGIPMILHRLLRMGLLPGVPLLITTSFGALAQETALETGKFGDWVVNQDASKAPTICFAASQPQLKEPAGANRAKTVLYVSAWPKDGVKTEVSIKLGYPIKPGSPVAVTVGANAFQLFAKDDRAYIADPTDELKLVEAMKSGTTLVVKATSAKGTQTTDTYSLKGLDQALAAVAAACP